MDSYVILMADVFNELISNDNPQRQQLLVCLATTLVDNILPDSTIDQQFDDDQCKTPNERYRSYTQPLMSNNNFVSRNLALIRRLDEQPLVWTLLELIAAGKHQTIASATPCNSLLFRPKRFPELLAHHSMPALRVDRPMGELSRRGSSPNLSQTTQPLHQLDHAAQKGTRALKPLATTENPPP